MLENKISSPLSSAMQETISSAIPTLATYAELGVDSFMDEGLFKSIPFVSSAISLFKIGSAIHDLHAIKQLTLFIDAINDGIGDETQREEYLSKLLEKKAFMEKQLKYIVLLLDRYIEYDKPKMLASLYLAYLRDCMDWDEFAIFATMIDRLFRKDFILLCHNETVISHHDQVDDSVLRLIALGLMKEMTTLSGFEVTGTGGLSWTGHSLQKVAMRERTYKRTPIGDKLVNLLYTASV